MINHFSLKPFSSTGLLPKLKITGKTARRSNTLAISYACHGPVADLLVPAAADVPCRKNALWGDTCFEFFLGAERSDQYWEFNLSPAGHWNVYRFISYRQGMHEEHAFTSLPFSVRRKSGALLLSVEVDLNKIIRADQALKAGICAVIKTRDGKLAYWALIHPGPQADFHRRESFIIVL
ncbi:MAG: DOMON-like domain-containing protein [Nitrospirae bacterium]|nr:DOMON-like domain-containing protein [Nitrospirota bacterium]